MNTSTLVKIETRLNPLGLKPPLNVVADDKVLSFMSDLESAGLLVDDDSAAADPAVTPVADGKVRPCSRATAMQKCDCWGFRVGGRSRDHSLPNPISSIRMCIAVSPLRCTTRLSLRSNLCVYV